MLIFPSIGGGVCSRSRRRQRQPNHGAGSGGRDEAKTGGDDGRKEETRPPFLWAAQSPILPPVSLSHLSSLCLPPIQIRFLSPNPLPLSLSRCVLLSLLRRFGGLFARSRSHAHAHRPACHRGGSCYISTTSALAFVHFLLL